MLRRLIFLALVLAVIPIAATTARAQSESSACFGTPTDTVNTWLGLFPSGAPTEQLCIGACQRWLKTCNDMSNTSYRCLSSLFRNLTLLDLAECNFLMGTSKADCIANAQASLRSLLLELESDLDNAQSICAGNLGNCIDNCID